MEKIALGLVWLFIAIFGGVYVYEKVTGVYLDEQVIWCCGVFMTMVAPVVVLIWFAWVTVYVCFFWGK
jgi:hypothetical protein